ncbi:Glycerol uptake facilitator protein [Porphyridium purpureum]|uniref:Glycerol uptake facilitator protein n=1 Tax=Porphyridium purpureum TaxID=35688 RepID=A0A5J4YXL6_PORPP|nr:Glycerol uptake facilitator protein [Porphyridium purpureum]|eukprot:POR6256..scf208_2
MSNVRTEACVDEAGCGEGQSRQRVWRVGRLCVCVGWGLSSGMPAFAETTDGASAMGKKSAMARPEEDAAAGAHDDAQAENGRFGADGEDRGADAGNGVVARGESGNVARDASGLRRKPSMVERLARAAPGGIGGGGSGLGGSKRVRKGKPVRVQCVPSSGPVLGGNVVKIMGVPQHFFVQSSNGECGPADDCDNQACMCHHKPEKSPEDTESPERESASDDMDGLVKFSCGVELFFGLIPVPYTATMDDKGNNVLVATVPRASYEGLLDVRLMLEGTTIATSKYNYESALLNAPDHEEPRIDLRLPAKYVHFLRRLRGTHVHRRFPSLLQQCLAEAIGTGMIVLFGVGIVNAAVFTGAQVGIWQVAVVWGFGVSLAIYCTASISGAHLNPAVSFALALLRPEEFPLRKLVPYWIAQFAGAIVAAAINLLAYSGPTAAFEARNNIIRGEPSSILSAQAYGEYFPNPGLMYSSAPAFAGDPAAINPALDWTLGTVTVWGSLGIEAWGTAVLMFVILALTDKRNTALVQKEMAPFFIGFTVASLISLYAPMNQAGYNPARDWGPRIVSAMAGWGKVAFPGPQNGCWTYLVGPLIGAPIGGAFYEFIFMHGL